MLDTSKMKYDLGLVGANQLVTQVFPELLDYKEYADPEHDQMLRVVFFAHDFNSPFLQRERDNYEKRMLFIFEHLGIEDEALLTKVITHNHPVFVAILNRFVIQFDNLAYVMWTNMFFNFHMIGIALRQSPDMKNLTAEMAKRAALQNQQKELHTELIKYEAQIFPDVQARITVRNEYAKVLTLPEHYAQEKQVI